MTDVTQYWRAKEALIGEAIIGKHFCKYLGGHPDIKAPSWGLIFYSQWKFCFQGFTSHGRLASMVRFGDQLQEKEAKIFCYSRNELTFEVENLDTPFWKKLFFSTEKILVVGLQTDGESGFSCRFELSTHDTKSVTDIFC